MRPGQNRRMRGRNNNNNSSSSNNNNGNRKAPNPLQRSYESNGPDVKVRGTAQHVAEKYLQLARDAQSSGDPVAAENYFQHAEHYYRILLAAQEQMAQQFGHSFPPNRGFVDDSDEGEEGGEDDGGGQPFQQQGAAQPEFRGNANGGGYAVNVAPRQDTEGGDGQQNNGQRFERPRNNDRFNEPRDRNEPRRFDRSDRPDRGNRRPDRPEGGQNGQGYAPRSDNPAQSEQPGEAVSSAPASERRPERTERPERGPRPERAERRPRNHDEAGDSAVEGALPSFLMTPVRVPITVADEPVRERTAAAEEPVSGDGTGEAAPKRARRRRSPREVMDALGSDGDSPTE